jgi:hypothetical protein
MALRIPIGPLGSEGNGNPVREQITTLGGAQRRLRFTWKDRPYGGGVYLDVFDLDGTVIAKNRRLNGDATVVWDIGSGTNAGSLICLGPSTYSAEMVGVELQLFFFGPDDPLIPDITPSFTLTTTILSS